MHSCKDNNTLDDELFYPVMNSIQAYGDGAGRCLRPETGTVGSEFTTAVCDLSDSLQDICWMADGTLRLNDGSLDKCLVSNDGSNSSANGGYFARGLTLEDCDSNIDAHKLWQANDSAGVGTTSGSGCVTRELEEDTTGAATLAMTMVTLIIAANLI